MKTLIVRNSSEKFVVGNIYCLGRNYPEHAKEMRADVPARPIVFVKPTTAVIANGQPIIRPALSHELHHEVELVVAIGKGGSSIPADRASEHVLGYAVGLDMTLRDVQSEAKSKGLPWTTAKGFRTSAPVSEIIPASFIKDPEKLEITCTVNGSLRQKTSVDKMVFSVGQIVEYLSTVFSLESGDLIFTGTPEGVGEVKNGDVVRGDLVGWTFTEHPVTLSAK